MVYPVLGYLERDQKIVDKCDVLIACPEQFEEVGRMYGAEHLRHKLGKYLAIHQEQKVKGKAAVDVVADSQNPLSNRVYEQLAVVRAILANHALLADHGRGIEFTFPFDLKQLIDSNLGQFLR